jgi:hypothetical protein
VFTSPSMRIFQARGSPVTGSGTWPLLRMKNLSAGVTASSSRCSGVSATSGRSPCTISGAFPSMRSVGWSAGA